MSQSESNFRDAISSSNPSMSSETAPRVKGHKLSHRGNKTTPGGKSLYKIAFTIHK